MAMLGEAAGECLTDDTASQDCDPHMGTVPLDGCARKRVQTDFALG
jgi:hypothetical protein